MILKGKRGLITGIANNRSIATAVAKFAKSEGAELAFSYNSSRVQSRVEDIASELAVDQIYQCDASNEDSVRKTFVGIKAAWGNIDFVLHSIAYADINTLKGKYLDTSLEHFTQSMTISCYSLNLLTKYALPLMSPKKNGSIVTLTYYGATKVMPSYNLMGVAKAALEASVRYLACDVGSYGIRVNGLSAGPIKTLSASAISGFSKLTSVYANVSPLRRALTLEDVAKSAVYLLSDLSSGITGEIHFVDCGYNIIGAPGIVGS